MTRPVAREAPRSSPPPAEPRLVACPVCGASNAASRRRCGRCGRDLTGDEPPYAIERPPLDATQHVPEEDESSLSGLFLIAVVLAGLVLLGVLLAILTSRDIGPFAGPAETDPAGEELAALEVTAVRASSFLPPSGAVTYVPANLIDGDPTTAWQEGAPGAGDEEWVELDLAEPAPVTRVLVWNGYQKEQRFAEHPRVARVRIDVGERTFTAELLDVEGPQAVDLPEAVTADRVRLTILDIHPGERYPDAALSEVELRGQPGDG